jgi:diguanylate cyclase (GGDEF)-like protein
MPFRETIAAFLATQLDFIFFFYGLSFILLGAVCFAIARMRERESAWVPLGLFGLVHGVGEWLDLIALVSVDARAFQMVRVGLMAGSFLLLMEFARQTAIRIGLRPPGWPLYLALVFLVVLGGAVGGLPMASAFARYFIGFFAAAAASAVIFLQARGLSGIVRRLALATSAGFALYGVAAGLIVPASPFWPANVVNYAWFIGLTGLPIQLLRGLLACLLALSVWATWGQLLVKEVASDRYTVHLRRQFTWTLTALATILVLGWVLTQFLGDVYNQHVEQSAQGDVNLIASRLNGETASVDGMVRVLAGSPSVLPLLAGGNAQDKRRARSELDLNVDASGARFGAILDISGTPVASSDQVEARDAAAWPAAPWFLRALTGQGGSHFAFDPGTRSGYYYASYPVRRDGGSIAGVAVLQKSLGRLDADLKAFAHAYYFVDPDGVVVLTNRPDSMLRTLWPLDASRKSELTGQFGALDERPLVAREIKDASWVAFDDERSFVRRSYIGRSQWSVVLAVPSARVFANRIVGILVTLLVTLMILIYFFGREHGLRDRIQLGRRRLLQKMARDLRLKAATDPLTGLFNRAKFDEALADDLARAQRHGTPLALIMFDVDHFKNVNDTHGHPTGDEVLVSLAQMASGHVRNTDLLARWGGEEFVLLVPGSDGATAYRTAEKLRTLISEAGFGAVGELTCSFGVTEFSAGDSAETLMARADSALYRAKMNGRNRTEQASATTGIASVA